MKTRMGWRMYQKSWVVKRDESYAAHLACFACRKMFNKHLKGEITERSCPQCGSAMINMGNGFKPPKRNDLKRWHLLKKQALAGRRFWYCPSWL